MKGLFKALAILLLITGQAHAAITDSLISFWPMEEASGTRNDAHSTNHLTGGTLPSSGTGKVGTAADFETSSSNIASIGDNASLSSPTTSITFAAWINFESKVSNAPVAGKYQGNAEWVMDYRGTQDRLRFAVFGATSFADPTEVFADNLGSPATSTWYFVIGWYDRDADIIGIKVNNGTANTAARTTDLWDSANNFSVGGNSNFSVFFDGLIDQIGFWQRALTSDEHTWLYNSGNGRSYAEIVAGIGSTRRSVAPVVFP